jgi:hypothetical protein
VKRHVEAICERVPRLYGPYSSLGVLAAQVAAAKGALKRSAMAGMLTALMPPEASR